MANVKLLWWKYQSVKYTIILSPITLSADRSSFSPCEQQDYYCFERLEKSFGENILPFLMIVFTGGDQLTVPRGTRVYLYIS